MKTTLATILSLALAVVAAPISQTSESKRSLIDLSPVVNPDINLGGDHQCTGIGISVCDPINVGGDQNNSDKEETSKDDQTNEESRSDKVEDKGDGDDSLINVSPEISPDLSLGGDHGCFGVGISACDPINVHGNQGNGKRS